MIVNAISDRSNLASFNTALTLRARLS